MRERELRARETRAREATEVMEVMVDGRIVRAAPGTSVLVALLNAGMAATRTSVRGDPRGPICGMGICFECRVTIDGVPHRRACLVTCEPGMVIDTLGGW